MKLFGNRKRPSGENSGTPTVDRLRATVDALPWFGEEPFPASPDRHAPRRVQDDIPYIRRTLVSWLIGRPVSQVARRAGCSPRLVHKVIYEYFYGEPDVLNWHFEQWFELGLIAAIDTPETELETEDEGPWPEWLKSGHVTVACLVCHRLIGSLPYEELEHSGTWIREVSQLLDRLWFLERQEQEHGATVQGHLMCHFALEYNPIRPLRSPSRLKTLALKAALGNATARERRSLAAMEGMRRRSRYRPTYGLATMSLDEFLAGETGSLLPVRNGKEMSLEQARRWWRGMI